MIITILTLVGVLLLGGLSFCGLSFLDNQKHYPEYLADNEKVNAYIKTLTKSVEGKDKATILEYFRVHGVRSQVNSDGSIDCFPGRAATHTNRWYVESIHIEPYPDGKYWSFSFTYGGGSLFGF